MTMLSPFRSHPPPSVSRLTLAGHEEVGTLAFTVRETSASEWRDGTARKALSGVEASNLTSVFDRRVRLTVLRATGLAQVVFFAQDFVFGIHLLRRAGTGVTVLC